MVKADEPIAKVSMAMAMAMALEMAFQVFKGHLALVQM